MTAATGRCCSETVGRARGRGREYDRERSAMSLGHGGRTMAGKRSAESRKRGPSTSGTDATGRARICGAPPPPRTGERREGGTNKGRGKMAKMGSMKVGAARAIHDEEREVGLAALPGLLLSAIFRDPEGCGTAEATRVWELMSMASQDAYVRGAGDEIVPDCTSCVGIDAARGADVAHAPAVDSIIASSSTTAWAADARMLEEFHLPPARDSNIPYHSLSIPHPVSPRVRDASTAPITRGVSPNLTPRAWKGGWHDADVSREIDEETGQMENQRRLLHEQILFVRTGRAPQTGRRIQRAGGTSQCPSSLLSRSNDFHGYGTQNLRAGEWCHGGVRADSGEVKDLVTVVEIKTSEY
ncbi:hypothetical protein B0H13DRAFT_2569149 [Mycena leptocephala]|nr:hypothetical protein B0H13DRAFT_2569149 [Mycena leptocephala]